MQLSTSGIASPAFLCSFGGWPRLATRLRGVCVSPSSAGAAAPPLWPSLAANVPAARSSTLVGHSNPDSAGNDKRRGTAVAIAQLAELHRLAFHNTIARYLPDLSPAIADHVTIAELLTMTSGLDDAVLSRPNPPTTIAGMVKLIATERPEFKPGARFLYSNDGSILLGAIIEQVSGQSYDSYLREHIFEPAGLTHTD